MPVFFACVGLIADGKALPGDHQDQSVSEPGSSAPEATWWWMVEHNEDRP
jgi:hypothetical protein